MIPPAIRNGRILSPEERDKRRFRILPFSWAIFKLHMAAILACGFLAAVIMNEIIFSFWNLNFLQVANERDVLITGVDIFVRFAPPFIAFMLGEEFAYYIKDKSYRSTWLIIWVVLSIAAIVLWNVFEPYISNFSVVVLFLCPLIFTFGFGSHHQFTKAVVDEARKGRPEQQSRYVILIIMGLTAYAVGTTIKWIVKDGYGAGGLTTLSSPRLPPNCRQAKVLWVGTEAVVFSCGPARADIRVIWSKEDATLAVPATTTYRE